MRGSIFRQRIPLIRPFWVRQVWREYGWDFLEILLYPILALICSFERTKWQLDHLTILLLGLTSILLGIFGDYFFPSWEEMNWLSYLIYILGCLTYVSLEYEQARPRRSDNKVSTQQ